MHLAIFRILLFGGVSSEFSSRVVSVGQLNVGKDVAAAKGGGVAA